MTDDRERCAAEGCDNEGMWDPGEYCPTCRAEYDRQAAYYGAMFRAYRSSREAAELDAEGLRDDPRTLAYWEAKTDRADYLQKTERGE